MATVRKSHAKALDELQRQKVAVDEAVEAWEVRQRE